MRRLTIIILVLLFISIGVSRALAMPALFDWAFNVDGTTYEASLGDTLPDFFDDSAFNWTTGLGTLTIKYNPWTTGDHYIISFFDHEIDVAANSFFNEYGTDTDTPIIGQSWEIDEPGYVFGDIYDHVVDPITYGFIDNTNNVPQGLEDDVAMAMGWSFSRVAGDIATITLNLGETIPDSGFYLSHTDSDSDYTFYFSSTLDITPIPEPGTLILLGCGLVGILGLVKKRFRE